MNAIVDAIIQLFKHKKKQPKPFEQPAKESVQTRPQPIVKKELIDSELYRYAEAAVRYMYQTTLLIPEVEDKMYETFKNKFMKKNQAIPSGVEGELLKEIKLLDVYFSTFLLCKEGLERGCDFSDEELRMNVENVIKQCMELERRFGIHYMSNTA